MLIAKDTDEEKDEFCLALDVLFDAVEKACKEAGLPIKIEYECHNLGVASVTMWFEDNVVAMYGGEITFIGNEPYRNRFLRWAQIVGASRVEELAEGLASDDIIIREKALKKKEELAGNGGG